MHSNHWCYIRSIIITHYIYLGLLAFYETKGDVCIISTKTMKQIILLFFWIRRLFIKNDYGPGNDTFINKHNTKL